MTQAEQTAKTFLMKKPKYDVYDVVYIISENKILSAVVTEVYHKRAAGYFALIRGVVNTTIEYSVRTYYKSRSVNRIRESEIYACEEEARNAVKSL